MDLPPKKYRTILIVTVMEEESQPLLTKLSMKSDPTFVNPICECFKSQLGGLNIVLLRPWKDPKYKVDSIGPEMAGITTYIGITHFKPDLVLSVGSCGGVLKGLKVGDVCMAKEEIRYYDREMIFEGYRPYVEGKYEVQKFDDIREKIGILECVVGSGSSFTNSQVLQESKGIHICEMESAAVGKVSFWMGVPFNVMKVISDVDCEEEDRYKMFEQELGSVSERLAGKLHEFLVCLDSK